MKPTLRMTSLMLAGAAALTLAACGDNTAAPSNAEPTVETPMAMPEPAEPTQDIVAAASVAPDFTTLTSAVQSADLAQRLAGPGPFTVFAPTNAAFEKIPLADRTALMQPSGKAELTKVLTYHIVPGRLLAADIQAQAAANQGTASLTTIQGGKLTLKDAGNGQWEITDTKGNTSKITLADQLRTNGVVHVVDTVLMPAT